MFLYIIYFSATSLIVALCTIRDILSYLPQGYLLIVIFIIFPVYRLGGRGDICIQSGERSEFQRRVRILHENGALPKLCRNTADLGRHTGWVPISYHDKFSQSRYRSYIVVNIVVTQSRYRSYKLQFMPLFKYCYQWPIQKLFKRWR